MLVNDSCFRCMSCEEEESFCRWDDDFKQSPDKSAAELEAELKDILKQIVEETKEEEQKKQEKPMEVEVQQRTRR